MKRQDLILFCTKVAVKVETAFTNGHDQRLILLNQGTYLVNGLVVLCFETLGVMRMNTDGAEKVLMTVLFMISAIVVPATVPGFGQLDTVVRLFHGRAR